MTIIDHTDMSFLDSVITFRLYVIPTESITQIEYILNEKLYISMFHACCSVRRTIAGPTDYEICLPIAKFDVANGFFSLNFKLPHLSSQILWIHSWVSAFKNGGRIADSDGYFVIDRQVISPAAMIDNIPNSVTLEIDLMHIQGSDWQFEGSVIYDFNPHSLGSWPLQKSFSMLCVQLQLQHCFHAVSQVMNHIYKINLLAQMENMPQVSINIPTPKTPFVFLHIEKCAGTFLRE
jgi:hypothetical protein